MSSYENPQVPHEVNVAKTSALGEAIRLILGLALCCIVLVVAVILGMRLIAPYIPFRYEQAIANPLVQQLAPSSSVTPSPSLLYLQALADSLAAKMDLPADMPLTVHVSNTSAPNAFATLGGHLIVTQGLLNIVDSENALAMIVAHEVAHIVHRDPIVSVGSGIVLSIVLSAIFGNSDFAFLGASPAALTQMSFSRGQEAAADKAALTALQAKYGHTNDAEHFFRYILEHSSGLSVQPEFLSTHPDTRNRLKNIENDPNRQQDAALTPLPEFLRAEKTTSPPKSL